MKSTVKIVLFVFLMCGVFGADTDQVKTLMEGDSVTLNPDPTKIQGFNKIQWRFEDKGLGHTYGKDISYEDEEIFRGRLKLDNQTGSLTIKNMKTKHSGLYKLEVNHDTGTSYMTFTVNVYESPSVIDAHKPEKKSVSVMEGDPVTLQTDITELHGDELIVWRFEDDGKLIAKSDIETKSLPLYYSTDERFKDKLQLNDQTGSLTIKNMRSTDSGLYTVKISSSNQMLYKRFNVTVSVPDKQTPGAGGGLWVVVVVVLLLLVVAVALVIYYCYKTSKLKSLILEISKQLKQLPEISKKLQQMLKISEQLQRLPDLCKNELHEGKTSEKKISEISEQLQQMSVECEEELSKIHQHLKQFHEVIIQKCRKTSEQLNKCKSVTENPKIVPVIVGDCAFLKTEAQIKGDERIQWMFGDEKSLVAEINVGTEMVNIGRRFKDRLAVDKKTGSVTIKDTKNEDSGVYTLMMSSSRENINKTIFIVVQGVNESAVVEPLLNVEEQEGTSPL